MASSKDQDTIADETLREIAATCSDECGVHYLPRAMARELLALRAEVATMRAVVEAAGAVSHRRHSHGPGCVECRRLWGALRVYRALTPSEEASVSEEASGDDHRT